MDENAPQELKVIYERIENALKEAYQSPAGMFIDANRCEGCADHWHIMICPAVREIVGGAQDGAQAYPRFVLHLNKMSRVFDKRPRMVFDSALGESVPHVVFIGKINGHKCDVSVMCCPPTNMEPFERYYTEGPKKGTVEAVSQKENDDEA